METFPSPVCGVSLSGYSSYMTTDFDVIFAVQCGLDSVSGLSTFFKKWLLCTTVLLIKNEFLEFLLFTVECTRFLGPPREFIP